MSPYNFFVCGPKFTQFFSPNVEGAPVDKILFLFAICRCVPEIFAIKVESCQKALWILDIFFALPNFRGQAFQKLYPFYHPRLPARHLEKVLWGYTHQSGSYRGSYAEFFKPNFKFSRLNFFRGSPFAVVVCASKSWPSFTAIGRGTSENAWRKKKEIKKKNITSIL